MHIIMEICIIKESPEEYSTVSEKWNLNYKIGQI